MKTTSKSFSEQKKTLSLETFEYPEISEKNTLEIDNNSESNKLILKKSFDALKTLGVDNVSISIGDGNYFSESASDLSDTRSEESIKETGMVRYKKLNYKQIYVKRKLFVFVLLKELVNIN